MCTVKETKINSKGEQVVPNHDYSEHGKVPSGHDVCMAIDVYTKYARVCINLHEICTNLQVCELDKAGYMKHDPT